MAFKENLLKKIEIDSMAEKIISTLGPVDSGLKLDKETMRRLLEMSNYQLVKKRDLELYVQKIVQKTVQKTGEEKSKILVLDNDLPIYFTAISDVVLRKSPTIKEMVSIRNAIKILTDSDVILSKKEDSLKQIQKECIEMLDLSFNRKDIEEIEKDGTTSLEKNYIDGVSEVLLLYSELLGFSPVPKRFRIRHNDIFGKTIKNEFGRYELGPLLIFNKMDNSLKWIENSLTGTNQQIDETLRSVSMGKEKAPLEGSEVFQRLTNLVRVKPL